MNVLKKVYCRTFQTVLWASIPILPYRRPRLLRNRQQVAEMLLSRNIRSVLLITDADIRRFGITQPLEAALEKAGISCTVYDRTVANPTTANVEEARKIYLENHCEALIGFGGGSSIDCAKAVGARLVRPAKELKQMGGILKVKRQLPVLIAIPTTAGTGSETTMAAVIVDSDTHHKYPIEDFPLIPQYALLDPDVTLSLPPSLTATTGMDALTHAVEAYIGRSTTPQTRKDAEKAVQLVFDYLIPAYQDGGNRKARANMLCAAHLAGCAFTVSYVGYVHAVAHSLGGKYNTPHGLANAVLLPFVLEAYGDTIHKPLHRLAMVVGISTEKESDAAGAAKFIRAIRTLRTQLGIGNTLPGIRAEDIPELARTAEREANPLYPVPKLMTAEELEQFYYDVLEDI